LKVTLESLDETANRTLRLQLPNGTVVVVGDLTRSLGRAVLIIESGTLVAQAAAGNPDVALVASFLASGPMGAALPAGTPAILAFTLAASASWLAAEGTKQVIANLEVVRNDLNRVIAQNPDANLTQAFIQMVMEALGAYGPNHYNYNPPPGTGDPNEWIP
jgi:hypothetical protein